MSVFPGTQLENYVREGATKTERCETVAQFSAAAARSMDRVNGSIAAYCQKTAEWQRKAESLRTRMEGLTGDAKARQGGAMRMAIARCNAEVVRRRAVCSAVSAEHQEMRVVYKQTCAMSEATEDAKLEKMRAYTLFLIRLEGLVIDGSGRVNKNVLGSQLGEHRSDAIVADKAGLAAIRDSLSGEFDVLRSERSLEMPQSVYDKIPEDWPEKQLPEAFLCYNTDLLFQSQCPQAYAKIKNTRKTADLSDLYDILSCLGSRKKVELFWNGAVLVHHVIETIMETSTRRTYATGEQPKAGFTVDARYRMVNEVEALLKQRLYCFREGKRQVAGTGDSAKILFQLENRKGKPIRKLHTPAGLAEMLKARRANAKAPVPRKRNIVGFTGFAVEPACPVPEVECPPEKPRHVLLPCGPEGGRAAISNFQAAVRVNEQGDVL